MRIRQIVGLHILSGLAGLAPALAGAEGTPTTLEVANRATPISVPAQPIETALNEFARQSGVHVVIDSRIAGGVISAPVQGTVKTEEGLTLLLKGTGLTYRVLDGQTVSVERMAERATSTDEAKMEVRLAQAASVAGQGQIESQDAAADSGQGARLEEIVVTAQKRVERLQDVPVPVTAISGETLATHNQLRLQDYYNKVPGLGLVTQGNGGAPIVNIRGIITGPSTNPTVGIVVDEVSYGSTVITGGTTIPAPDIDPGDLARIEVLRGPQGTLYGAASMGGLLKFITVDPSTDRVSGRLQVGSTSLSHSDDFGYTVRGAVNVPLGDAFAIRASAFTLQDPGYIDNPETGEDDANSRGSKGGRLSALWRISENFSFKLNAQIQDSERQGTEDVDTALGSDPQQPFLPGTGEYHRQTEAYGATLTGKIGEVELTSATGYSTDEFNNTIDLTLLGATAIAPGFLAARANARFSTAQVTVNRVKTTDNNTVDKFTQEIRASLPLGERLHWLVGAFYTKEDTVSITTTEGADAAGATYGILAQSLYDPSTFEEYAAFTNLTVDITDRWDIQFGGRYSHDRQVFPLIRTTAFFAPAPPVITPPLKTEENTFTYLVTPRFRVSGNLMAYARFASGYRPGGPNALCGSAGVPCDFEPDTTQNYDLGVKGSALGGALTYDASLYYIDWQDLQIPNIRIPDPNSSNFFSFTGNVSRAKSQGVELSIESRPHSGLTISAWGAYNEAELIEDFPNGSLFGLNGDRLPYSSRFSGNLSVDQDFPLWGTASGFVGGSLIYVGDRKGQFRGLGAGNVPLPRATFPSYAQVDLRAGVRYDTWTVDIFANNVGDKRGILRGGVDAPFLPSYFTYIQPRTVGLSISKSFD